MAIVRNTILLGLTAAVIGCGGGDDRARRTNRDFGGAGGGDGGAATLKTVDMATAGTVSGTVTFNGTAPPQSEINMASEPICKAIHTVPIRQEKIVVNGDGTLRNCFMYLDVGDRYEVPTTSVEVDQKGCVYYPHVFGVQVGQEVLIKNSDRTLHNVHYVSIENGEENIAMNRPMEKKRTFERPEVGIKVYCDVHPWMGAWFSIMTHPFFAVTDDKGSFSISGVPPGNYKLILWHENAAFRSEQNVTVATGETTTADFTVNG